MIPFCGLRYKRAVIYSLPLDRINTRKEKNVISNLGEDREKAYRGNMSVGSQRRLKKAFENLTEISDWKNVRAFKDIKQQDGSVKKKPYNVKFRINFITLTLPAPQGQITDRTIYNECFKPFIDALRYKFPSISYVWKAEVQKNGNLHFHITANEFVDYRWIRSNWNKQTAKLGFIKAFAAKHGHTDPNSTDVVSVRNDSDLGAYISKYISKIENDKRKLGIKVWDCSKNLKFKEIRNEQICNEVNEWIDDLIRENKVQVITTDQAVILQSPVEWDPETLPRSLRQSHKRYLALLKDHSCKYQTLYNNAIRGMSQKKKKEEEKSVPPRKMIRGVSGRYNIKDQLMFDFARFKTFMSYV